MTTTADLEDTARIPPDLSDGAGDRLHRVEDEVSELRHAVSELAAIVVRDIRDRREAAGLSAPAADLPIPTPDEPSAPSATSTASSARRPWLLVELLREVGLAIRMYMDPRYRVRRATKVMVPVILILFGLNYLIFNQTLLDVPVFRHILERVVDVVLAVLLYKVISREVVCYRQVVARLAGVPRSWYPTPVSLWNTDPDTAPVTRQESP